MTTRQPKNPNCTNTLPLFDKGGYLNFYSDVGNILSEIPLTMVDDSVTYIVRELCELKDHVNTCKIVSHNMIHVL